MFVSRQLEQLEHRHRMVQNECQASKAASHTRALELRRLIDLASAPLAQKLQAGETDKSTETQKPRDIQRMIMGSEPPEDFNATFPSSDGADTAQARERQHQPTPSLLANVSADHIAGEVTQSPVRLPSLQSNLMTRQGREEGSGKGQPLARALEELPPCGGGHDKSVPEASSEQGDPSHGHFHQEEASLDSTPHDQVTSAVEAPESQNQASGRAPVLFPTLAGDIASSFMGMSTSLNLPASAKFEMPVPSSAFEIPMPHSILPHFRLSAPSTQIMPSFLVWGNDGKLSTPEPPTPPSPQSAAPCSKEGRPMMHASSWEQESQSGQAGKQPRSARILPSSLLENMLDMDDRRLASGTLKGLV